jgi:hypothetical protein
MRTSVWHCKATKSGSIVPINRVTVRQPNKVPCSDSHFMSFMKFDTKWLAFEVFGSLFDWSFLLAAARGGTAFGRWSRERVDGVGD